MQTIQISPAITSFLIDQDGDKSIGNVPIIAPFRIGRREGLDLWIPSPNVSGLHAEILEEDGSLWLYDLNSTNGTFVNDQRIVDKTKLEDSDSIVFGNKRFRLILTAGDPKDGRIPMATVPTASPTSVSESPKHKFQRLLDTGAVPFFQPIRQISNDSQRLIGYEVLGRSRIFGLTTPQQMFAAAIPLDMESELSRVLRQRGIEAAKDKLPEDLKLFVNTHSAELEHGVLDESLRELREFHPNRPIVLELSEKSFNDPRAFSELRSMLRDLNIGLALHDFSAGKIYLAELNEIAPDIVKFDCALLQGVNKASLKRQRLIRAMVKMVKELGIIPMAEYVESNEEHETLVQLGFEYAQGFQYGRPVDIETVSSPSKKIAEVKPTVEEVITTDSAELDTTESSLRPLELLKKLPGQKTPNELKQKKISKQNTSESNASFDDYEDSGWIMQQLENHYTIQLSVSPSKKSAEQFISRQTVPGDYAIYAKRRNTSDLSVVLYGVFENRAVAKREAESFKQLGICALIYRLSSVQNEIRKNKTLNPSAN